MRRSNYLHVVLKVVCAGVLILFTWEVLKYFTQNKKNERAEWNTINSVNNAKSWRNLNYNERILFDPQYPVRDRIIAQNAHIPRTYRTSIQSTGNMSKPKYILQYDVSNRAFFGTRIKPGNGLFQGCPVKKCAFVFDRRRISDMDAVVYAKSVPDRSINRIPFKQIWILATLESPRLDIQMKPGQQFNWTMTYRDDSTIPFPFSLYILNKTATLPKKDVKNHAVNRTKKIAWFVSNCKEVANNRMWYVRQLSKYIPVDIYGRCGKPKCRNGDSKCMTDTLKNYKFYIAFENSNCRYYITEKINTALWNGVLPIVMGAPIEDYRRRVPANSFIHVDNFTSPEHLAQFLIKLDRNDTLYNTYFKWIGTGRFVYYRNPWCRICSLLHEQDSRPPLWYQDGYKWWRGEGVCRPNWKG